VIVVAKRNSWRRFCESIENVSQGNKATLNSQQRKHHLGCTKFPSGDYTGSVEESLGHLKDVHFAGSQGPFGGSDGKPEHKGGYKPREWRLAAKVVYASGVERAIKTFKPNKAPGTDGIYPILLKKGLQCLLGPLTKVFRASIALRHVPQAWKITKVVFIPKPGKNVHIYAKDWLIGFSKQHHWLNIPWLPPNMPTGRAGLLRLHYTN
jgi:hypothetical protein